ncbi:MAG: ATP-binding cassette domain-containing protein [Pseudonocardiaceae bacterium]
MADRVSKTFGNRLVLDEVSCTVSPGRRLGVVGRNGVGKTTLLSVLLGELIPTSQPRPPFPGRGGRAAPDRSGGAPRSGHEGDPVEGEYRRFGRSAVVGGVITWCAWSGSVTSHPQSLHRPRGGSWRRGWPHAVTS